MYVDAFKKAEQFTKKMCFDVPEIVYNNNEIKLRRDAKDIFANIFSKMQPTKPEDLAFKCAIISQILCEYISSETPYKAWVTIGTIIDDNKHQFAITQKKLEIALEKIKTTNTNFALPFHAWVTLETMEIIDLTYSASLIISGQYQPKHSGLPIIFDSPDDLAKQKFVYHPIIVGENYLKEVDPQFNLLKTRFKKKLSGHI